MRMGIGPTEVGPLTTPHEWRQKAEALRSLYTLLLGELPEAFANLRAEPEFGEPYPYQGVLRQEVTFTIGPGERTLGHLLRPLKAAGPLPTVLTLHQTTTAGRAFTIGATPEGPGHPKAYGLHLARHGFATFSYDQLSTGERLLPPGTRAFATEAFYERWPRWSVRGRDIADLQRAVEVLEAADGVDARRIGSMGHSQGGGLTIDGMIFEPRIKAGASNCGTGAFRSSINPFGIAREAWWIGIPRLRAFFETGKPAPIDLHERLALIAPRPFLLISAVNDSSYGTGPDLDWNEARLEELHTAVGDIYHLLGAKDAFHPQQHREGHDLKAHQLAEIVRFFQTHL